MAFSILSSFLSSLLEMDHVGVRTEGDKTVYIFKTTGLVPSLVEAKSKILSVLGLPVDIPEDISVREVKKGPLTKEYLVEITVDSRKIGKVSNLLAKKYPLILKRRRGYR